MSRAVRIMWDDALLGYDFGPSHPLAPRRLDLTMRLIREFGLLDAAHVQEVAAPPADERLLGLVHSAPYLEAVRRASADPADVDHARGLGIPDNPTFTGMHEASALVAGQSVAAAEAVWSGRAEHAVNIAGGLHHAMPHAASGFCVYNDPALAIARLLELGAERVAYVDVDVHHGDGVEAIFYHDPRVLTVSLHETGRFLFPGTGFPDEIGALDAEGSAVNVALPPGTGDEGWLRAFHAIVPHVLRAFRPQVLVTQHGCDSHALDPLAHLGLSIDGQRTAGAALHAFAHELTDGRWVATGGGGYEIVDVVPRAWTHLVAEAIGTPLDPQTPTPEGWRDHVQITLRRVAPQRMTDGHQPEVRGWEGGYDPADRVDQAVLATRKAVFPPLGLDPMMLA
jgi:acetoin utilization protein AcuC